MTNGAYLQLLDGWILLHTSPGDALTSAWNWTPAPVLGCAALLGAYLWLVRSRLTLQAGWYVAGVLLLLLALVSPLAVIGELYLFSVHMVQHLLLVLVVPFLLLLGIPRWLTERVLARSGVRRSEGLLARPAAAWMLGVGCIWIWHIPALYNLALANHALHIVEHLTFLVTATIFWWPVLMPLREERLSPLLATIYLMAGGMANGLLGIVLAFAPSVLYSAYINPADPLGLLPLLRGEWGVTARADQELAGLILTVPVGLIYGVGVLIMLYRWLASEEVAGQAKT